jgi:F-type H+-transporting ATPase subunit a
MEEGLHITLASERLFTLWGIPITNSLITTWVVMALLLVGGYFLGKSLSVRPGRVQAAVEDFFRYLLHMMEETLGSRELAVRYFPLIMTIFVFVLTANMLDILPIFGSIGFTRGGEFLPIFHAVNADLNTPLALAIVSFVVIELSGILTLGVLKYGGKFINIRGGAMMFVVGLLELVGNVVRLVSFSFRLFGAIFAGEVLLLVIAHFLPYIASVPFMAFEAFEGLLQAAVFAILTLAFIKIAIDEPHGSHEHAPAAH